MSNDVPCGDTDSTVAQPSPPSPPRLAPRPLSWIAQIQKGTVGIDEIQRAPPHSVARKPTIARIAVVARKAVMDRTLQCAEPSERDALDLVLGDGRRATEERR